MYSTCQKTYRPKRTLLSVETILTFIPMIYPFLSAVGQFCVALVTDDDSIKILNYGKPGIIRLVGMNASETFEKKNEPGQPFHLDAISIMSLAAIAIPQNGLINRR